MLREVFLQGYHQPSTSKVTSSQNQLTPSWLLEGLPWVEPSGRPLEECPAQRSQMPQAGSCRQHQLQLVKKLAVRCQRLSCSHQRPLASQPQAVQRHWPGCTAVPWAFWSHCPACSGLQEQLACRRHHTSHLDTVAHILRDSDLPTGLKLRSQKSRAEY